MTNNAPGSINRSGSIHICIGIAKKKPPNTSLLKQDRIVCWLVFNRGGKFVQFKFLNLLNPNAVCKITGKMWIYRMIAIAFVSASIQIISEQHIRIHKYSSHVLIIWAKL